MAFDAKVNAEALDTRAKLVVLRDYTRTIGDRIAALRERADGNAANELLMEALHELDVTREELAVADEEICRAEARYAQSLRQLEAKVRHYGELFDGAPDGYALTDPRGVIREGNRTLAAMLGVHKRFLEGKPLVSFVGRADVCAYRTSLSALLDAGGWSGGGDGELLTLRLRPRHGESVFVAEVVARIVRGAGDRVSAIRWTVRKAPARAS